jgi:hypothetical protein
MDKRVNYSEAGTYLENEYRQLFRNLLFPERVKNLDVERWVKYGKDCGATSMFLDAKPHAYAYYDSAFVPKDPILGKRDLVAEFKKAAERHGLKWGAYLCPVQTNSVNSRGDAWQQRKADGATIVPLPGDSDWEHSFFCWNAPGLRELLSNVIMEIAEKYHPHGFYIDGMYFDHRACYCETCKALYRNETGKEMPPRPPDWNSPDWFQYIRWRHHSIAEAARMVHEAAHKIDPRVTVVCNMPYPWCGWYAAQSAAQAHWLDLVGTEGHRSTSANQAGFQTLAEQMGWLIGANRMLKGGKSIHLYTYFDPRTHLTEATTWNDLALAAGALPSVQEHCKLMKRVFARTKQIEPYLRGTVSAADVALHVSGISRDAYYRPADGPAVPESDRAVFNDRGFFEETRGMFTGLLQAHFPTELVHLEDGLEETDLSPFRAILLPNSVYLAPRAVERLQKYVENGGTVVATMETALRDRNGIRQGKEVLWPGSGLKFKGEIETVRPWFMKFDSKGDVAEIEDDMPLAPDEFLVFKGGTKPWLGEDTMLGDRPGGTEVREGGQFRDVPSCSLTFAWGGRSSPAPVLAVEVAADRNWETKIAMRFRRSKEKGWEECPAMAVRPWGKGRVCYLNFQLGTLIFSTGHAWWKNLLAYVINETAEKGQLVVDAPPCVKVFAWWQPAKQRYVLHLVNELSTAGMVGLQRMDLVPVSAKVRIAWPGITSARKVVGDCGCSIKRAGRKWTVQVENLKDRAILVCDKR